MDWRTEWPWSLEEEAEWKSELEQRKQGIVENLLDEVVEDELSSSGEVIDTPEGESAAGSTPEKYLVTT